MQKEQSMEEIIRQVVGVLDDDGNTRKRTKKATVAPVKVVSVIARTPVIRNTVPVKETRPITHTQRVTVQKLVFWTKRRTSLVIGSIGLGLLLLGGFFTYVMHRDMLSQKEKHRISQIQKEGKSLHARIRELDLAQAKLEEKATVLRVYASEMRQKSAALDAIKVDERANAISNDSDTLVVERTKLAMRLHKLGKELSLLHGSF